MNDDDLPNSPDELEGTGLGETIQQVIDDIEYFTLDKGGPTLHAVEEIDEENVMWAFCGEDRHINGMRVIQTFENREDIDSHDLNGCVNRVLRPQTRTPIKTSWETVDDRSLLTAVEL
ncbi:hypothetical protein HLRTI_000504 [Halorhabdus tiamatea SARL4B]|uniref:Uncharacterized protein n=1 Tax=Halorhabdus tiamatea SARL4B TaxID=1033806 RepID=F7PMQ1_9EURY|nr:hypothetical protein [Halorhabdus tiamatea]ERJ07461.1 hypothetical protein HLRTI_000504 [Halorhabdus tiamatea SARL4B]